VELVLAELRAAQVPEREHLLQVRLRPVLVPEREQVRLCLTALGLTLLLGT
jgi:hypothetical protein